MRTRSLRSVVYLGAVFGLIASLYAAAEVADAALAKACSLNGVVSCSTILDSGKTTVLGIPDWSIGVAGFVVILACAVLAERFRKDLRFTYLLALVTTAGVAFSLYFLYVEVFEIGGICPVCVSAYAMGWVAWGGALGLTRKALRRERRDGADARPSGA
jgi:uncharacterized membrane protein